MSVNQCRNNALLTLNCMLREYAPCMECIDKGLCFLLKHRDYHHHSLLNIISETFFRNSTRSAMFACLSWNNVSEEQMSDLMCETKIDASVLPFIACMIRMTALLQVSAVFFNECVKMHKCYKNFAFFFYIFLFIQQFKYTVFLFPASICLQVHRCCAIHISVLSM